MLGIRGRLELALLLTPASQLLPDPLDAVYAHLDSVRGQILLQPLWPLAFPRPLMRRLDRHLQPDLVTSVLRQGACARRKTRSGTRRAGIVRRRHHTPIRHSPWVNATKKRTAAPPEGLFSLR
jgi:hypothetical protein